MCRRCCFREAAAVAHAALSLRLACPAAQKLHTYSGSKNAGKALIAAEYNGVKITTPPFEMGVTNKTAAFLKLNPLGKVRRQVACPAAARR